MRGRKRHCKKETKKREARFWANPFAFVRSEVQWALKPEIELFSLPVGNHATGMVFDDIDR